MKKLFVHHPLFRLLSPLFSGALVYLLILLINNTIEDLNTNFFTQELYVCIGLAYIIQEAARIIIVLFNRLRQPNSFWVKSILHLGTTLLITVGLVTLTMYLYFTQVLSYTPNYLELLIFNSIFCAIAVFYVLLYISNQFLHRVNTEKLEKEELARVRMEEDFIAFKRDINPALLMESLEAILVLMKKDADEAESLTEDFASVYRYILSSKKKEIVNIKEELVVLKTFIEVLNRLPFREIKLSIHDLEDTWVVPGSLLYICEGIVRSSISSDLESISVELKEEGNNIVLKYSHEEKLNKTFNISDLKMIVRSYSHFTSDSLEMYQDDAVKTIKLPKIQLG
ncbi:histidine kinase [Flagellimonas meridianipacifica]|uniref:Histidine kinase n=1 Tax=Flagellimonas meridianipacifica TaxID=1080225 RepID=A0A2T0MBH4_9FLAO|nr:sensor histidine kinase [Allomuricauda pacifica]PRX54825.1 histidine kinase [Allomuricauda pacifica]